ncbi:MAG: collagen-like protein [Cyclobacteriaceae bacterium]
MKTKYNFYFLILIMTALAFALVSGCEGPIGPPGKDGVDGIDGIDGNDGTPGVAGNVTCLACHTGANILDKQNEFHQSVHHAGQIAVDYAGGRSSCARCHSSEGFIEFAETGDVAENIATPSAWECKTCHSIHETFEGVDYALRLKDPIEFIYDNSVVVDFGTSNLCANCHQTRRPSPVNQGGTMIDLDKDKDTGTDGKEFTIPEGSFYISSTHYGPHYGSQSNLLYGVGFAEMAGTESYPEAGSGGHMAEDAKCTGCHMSDYGNGQGGHTFNPALDACTECHPGASSFDINGSQTAIETQLNELRDLLVTAGVIEQESELTYEINQETGLIEAITEPGGYHPVVGVYTKEEAEAFFNWDGMVEDRSLGVHNPKYAKALLTNSIEALQ